MKGYIYIFTLLIACDFLVKNLGISMPASILGLIILFITFYIKGEIIDSIEEPSQFLLKYLPLFLIPLGVMVKELLIDLNSELVKMIAVSIVSLICATFITIFTITFLKKLNINKGKK